MSGLRKLLVKTQTELSADHRFRAPARPVISFSMLFGDAGKHVEGEGGGYGMLAQCMR